MKLSIRHETIKTLIEMAKKSNVEICGFLFGRREGDDWIVEETREVPNRLNSPTDFEMEPLEMVRAIDDAEAKGLEVVGIFHSHRNCPPRPSGRDIEGMRNWPVVWLIVTPEGEARAWVLRKGTVEEVEVIKRDDLNPP
jgi:proteasome lid subunit RPN8/RPN11